LLAIIICFSTDYTFVYGGEFMPSLEEGDFAVETRVLPGSNLQTSMTAISQGQKYY
jgi:cobalt-zinc-cadmium resistance protein CzcA